MGRNVRVERFEDLVIWQRARLISKSFFVITEKDKFAKDYRFKNQILAALGSIMDNIAEGFERGGNKEFSLFLGYAKGSCGEARSQMYRALDFGYITAEEHQHYAENLTILSKQISSLISHLNNSSLKGPKYK